MNEHRLSFSSYAPCGSCRFWLRRDERHCRNCGEGISSDGPTLLAAVLVTAGIPVTASLLYFAGDWLAGNSYLLAIPAAALVCYFLRQAKPAQAVTPLRTYEELTRERIQEITEQLDRLEAVHERVREQPSSPRWERVGESIRLAHERYREHLDGYRLLLFQVDLARWENRLAPLAADASLRLSYEEAEARLKALERLRSDGDKLLADFDEAGLGTAAGAAAVRAHAVERLEACEALRQALVAQQAALVLSGVDLLDEQELPALLSAPPEPLEVAEPFERLETEHARLLAEKEVADLLTSNVGAIEK